MQGALSFADAIGAELVSHGCQFAARRRTVLHSYGRQEERFPADAHVRVSPPL